MVTDTYGNKLKGFYLIGFFEKNERAKFLIETSKPFETDENGISHGKCFGGYPHNCFPVEWLFFETDVKPKDVHKDEDLKEYLNDTWKDWCKKHKRKYEDILIRGEKSK